MNKTIISEYRSNALDPPLSIVSTSSDRFMMKNLKCPLTDQYFIDPVIVIDGHTYERTAILDWVNIYSSSPTTGAPMDATFRENTDIKRRIQSMSKQK